MKDTTLLINIAFIIDS